MSEVWGGRVVRRGLERIDRLCGVVSRVWRVEGFCKVMVCTWGILETELNF